MFFVEKLVITKVISTGQLQRDISKSHIPLFFAILYAALIKFVFYIWTGINLV
jgi:hypothetical protein